ncbi:MAG: lysylphosphatidylglycerol synthase transmembrane domain-containing protein [Candidatus Hydrogenedentota bacterium]
MNKRHTLFWLAICVILLYLTFRDSNFDNIYNFLIKTKFVYLLFVILADFCAITIRSLKWQFLLFNIKVSKTRFGTDIKFSRIFRLIVIGLMVNTFLPFRMAEIIRSYILGEKENISKALVFGSTVIEGLWDIVFLFGVIGVSSFFLDLPQWLCYGGYIALFISVIFVLVILFLNKIPVLKKFSIVRSFIEGTESFHNLRGIFLPLVYCFLEWLFGLIYIKFTLMSLKIDISLAGIILILIAIYLSFSLTFVPGALGVFEFINKNILVGLLGVDVDQALSFIILLRVMLTIPITILGLVFLFIEWVSFREVRRGG